MEERQRPTYKVFGVGEDLEVFRSFGSEEGGDGATSDNAERELRDPGAGWAG